jgi:hypothetical protein
MTMAQMNIEVPGELNNVAMAAQAAISHLMGGQNFMEVASGDLLPVLFKEGGKLNDIKAELKDPTTLVWGAMILAGVAVKYGPSLVSLVKAKLSKKSASPTVGAAIVG